MMNKRGIFMKTILIEEHFLSPGYAESTGRAANAKKAGGNTLKEFERTCEIGKGRIAEMDEAGIQMQGLQLSSPGAEQLDAPEAIALCREANDYLADALKKYPTRFAGFAIIPTAAPDKAVQEMELRIKRDGFKAVLINGHIKDKYLSDKSFWPILEAAEKLDVPIYIHPTPPLKAIRDVYFEGFAPQVSTMFASAGWGWHIETAVHVIRLILSGAFDKYPRLQIIVGHLGEGLPFMLQRTNNRMSQKVTGLQRPMGDYLRQNVNYTFGGWYFAAPFVDLYSEVGGDRIIASADYPHSGMAGAKTFIESLPISETDKEKISHSNAERLLKL